MLRLLRAESAELTPEDLLPASALLPRVVRLALPPPRALERGPEVGADDVLRRNPLAVIVRSLARNDDENSEEGEDEEEAGEEEGEEEDEGEEAKESEEEEDEEASAQTAPVEAADLFLDGAPRGGADDDTPRYALHVNFGSDDLASLIRIELLPSADVAPLLEWCRGAPARFRAREAHDALGGSRAVDFDLVAAVLRALAFNGFCSRVEEERKKRRRVAA